MTTNPQRYIGIGLIILVLMVIAPPVADWCRETFQLPAGYGADGDQRFNRPMPAAVRTTVDELSAGADGSWVGERVADGAWVYELHLDKNGRSSLIRLTADGRIAPAPNESPVTENDRTVESGG